MARQNQPPTLWPAITRWLAIFVLYTLIWTAAIWAMYHIATS